MSTLYDKIVFAVQDQHNLCHDLAAVVNGRLMYLGYARLVKVNSVVSLKNACV